MKIHLSLLAATLASATAIAQPTLEVDASKVTAKISPMMYGLMTEEINHSYDGGLYAELIQNRIFKDDLKAPAHWVLVGGTGSSIALDESQPVAGTVLTTSLKLDATSVAAGSPAGIANDGYWGIPVRPSTTYRVSFFAKASAASGPLTVSIQSSTGDKVIASAQVDSIGTDWKKYSATIKTPTDAAVSADNRFVISTEKPGTYWFNLVSLFPPTYNDRPNGNRIDLMEMLLGMKPAFIRLPGGNFLEGPEIADKFPWKQTLGPLEQRPGHNGSWRYRPSDGTGLLEYLEWCEDLHAEAVLAVYAGYSLKGAHVNPGADLQPYVDDALDEIEYVTGDASTKWGARRIADGHPAPFPLHYIEIGNEDGFDKSGSYEARFAQFFDAIKKKYPSLLCISTVGGRDGLGGRFHVKIRNPDVVDEHYYCSAGEMMGQANQYDSFDRNGPRIFVGEWATREGGPTTNLIAGVADAAWMCGMERNADLVTMASYAPLFVNVNRGAWQWNSDLVGYDALTSYGSPSYYAQKLFAENLGDTVVATKSEGTDSQTWQPPAKRPNRGATPGPLPPARQIPTFFYSATKSSASGKLYLKLVNGSANAITPKIKIAGAGPIDTTGTATVITSAAPTDTNSIRDPKKIVPVTKDATGLGAEFEYALPAYSVTVLVLTAK